MVRVNYTSGASVSAAGCATSSHFLNLRNAPERARARDDAKRSQMGLMIKSKLRSHWRYHSVIIPASELLNELPVRVREEVEITMDCCLPYSVGTQYSDDDGDSELDNSNLIKHQLFSNDHASNLDPEIRQWLPRIACPAFPFSTWCHGGGQLGGAMLRHIETCEGFKAHFPQEYKKLFLRSSNPKSPLDEQYQVFKMTFGQLEFLKGQFGGERRKFTNVSAETLEAILHSWYPVVVPGAEEVLPSDFPSVRIPSYFRPADHESPKSEHGMLMADLATAPLSSSVAREDTQDASQLEYPELYLPPQLLHPASDPAYVAAAMEAHASRVKEASSLVHVPFPAEVPRDWFGNAKPMSGCELALLFGGDMDSHAECFQAQLEETVAQSIEYFNRVFA